MYKFTILVESLLSTVVENGCLNCSIDSTPVLSFHEPSIRSENKTEKINFELIQSKFLQVANFLAVPELFVRIKFCSEVSQSLVNSITKNLTLRNVRNLLLTSKSNKISARTAPV